LDLQDPQLGFDGGQHLPENGWLPSGKHTQNDGKASFFMGKLTIVMAMFNSYVTNNGSYTFW
jgi:hypothetical protein